ncbi:MAG: hypothetical protein RRZ65_08450 [Tannerellaceae bacterium]
MWNKLSILCVGLCCFQLGYSQEWLGQSKEQIRLKIESKGTEAVIVSVSDTVFKINCSEEDERCRKFNVSYLFRIKEEICISYRRILPIHSYWAITLRELILQQDANGSGNELDIDGETLLTDYVFDGYSLHLSLENNQLVLSFTSQ